MSKTNPIDLVDRYIATWNETDAKRRRDLLAKTWAEDACYLDPVMSGTGHAGIDSMLQGVQARFPGHRFRRTGTVDAYQDRVRFTWELVPDGAAEALIKGTDFAVLAGDGRLQAVTGFLDQVPA